MLKKLSMFLILACAALSFAQIKPSFQAFDADYLNLDEASKGYHHFTVRVDFAPWAFVAEGQVKVPQGDVDLLFNSIDNDQLYIEVAYSEAPVGASDGLEYQAGIYDVMIYYSDGVDEFPTKIKDLKVSLLPPISGDSWATGSLADAQGKRGAPGSVFKDAANANAIFQASAHPLSKAQAQASRKAAVEKKKQAAKARQDSIATAQKAEREAAAAAVAARKKAHDDSVAAAKAQRRNNNVKAVAPAPLPPQQYQQRPQQQYPQQQYQQRPQQQYPQQQQYQQRPQQQYPQQQQYQQRPQQQYPQQQQYQQRPQQQYPQQQQYQQRPQQQYPQQQPAPAAAPADPCNKPGMTALQIKRCKMNAGK